MATTPKQPQDHQAKAAPAPDLDEFFSYEVDGETFVMPHSTIDVLTPGWYRRNRGQSGQDFLLTCMETVAMGVEPRSSASLREGERLLAFLDRPGRGAKDDTQRILRAFEEHVGATVGE